MKYMLMMNAPGGGPPQIASWPKADITAHIQFMMGFSKKLRDAGELVAAEGFRVDGDEEPPLLVGSDAREIAAHIARVIRDPRTAQRLGADGRRYVHQHCDWERSAHMLDQLCRQVATISSAPQEHDIDIHRYRPIQSTRSSNSVVHPSA